MILRRESGPTEYSPKWQELLLPTQVKLIELLINLLTFFTDLFLFSDVNSWIRIDGDIDPEWIEALNSVLDDNRILTMASGERIKFGPEVNFVFETHG